MFAKSSIATAAHIVVTTSTTYLHKSSESIIYLRQLKQNKKKNVILGSHWMFVCLFVTLYLQLSLLRITIVSESSFYNCKMHKRVKRKLDLKKGRVKKHKRQKLIKAGRRDKREQIQFSHLWSNLHGNPLCLHRAVCELWHWLTLLPQFAPA